MMQLVDGNIMAGVGIGNIKLNITREALLKVIGTDYTEQFLEMGSIITIENAKFWIDTEGKVAQIGVGKGFRGMYKNIIGIGSTLTDVISQIGGFVEVEYAYELEDEKGICFELEDVDDWEQLTAPIEFIFVFRT